ncbi:ABC transporter [Jiangella anatolica]|uniref:ABC transporter n=1 Tax=Jiangella anatolica TaxID=2670374 RepID=A0A2W2BYT3_9ACTN|nr:ABC transporter [Jiangella anatolica]
MTGRAIAAEPIVRRGVFRALLRNPLTAASLVVLALFAVIAIIQPWILPYPPNEVNLRLTNAAPFGSDYLLGGDNYGRDILSRLIASTRGAFQAAAVLSVVAVVIGTTAGLIAGYYGRVFDSVASWLFSAIMAVPAVIILISLYTLLGVSTTVAMAVFGFLVSPSMFWMVRTLTRNVRNELYVDAARVAGLPDRRIVGRHVLIAIRAPVILMIAGLAGAGIAVQAGLEFLGLGQAGVPSWGAMLTDAFGNIYVAPEQLIWPAVALGLVTSAFTLISIGVRDTLEGTYVKPSTRARRREIEALLGSAAAERTLGGTADAATATTATTSTSTSQPLLAIDGLRVAYESGGSLTTVVDDVSFRVEKGEVVGVVGESGSGKTQTVFATLGLLPEEAIVARGSIRLDGRELLGLPERDLLEIRGHRMAYVPQEPLSNLDPSFTVGSQLVHGIRAQSRATKKEARDLALAMLDRVGIADPLRVYRRYPHQISGGMAQRVLIAGAVACTPSLLLADEPTTALDVTIQAEVLDLLRDLQTETGMGVLIVTHNFGVVADLCDRVVVMRSGRIVEEGRVGDVFTRPQHEYTRMLLGSVLDNAAPREASARRKAAHA